MARGLCFFFQAEDGIRDYKVTGVQTCALPISRGGGPSGRGDVRCPEVPGGEPPHSPAARQARLGPRDDRAEGRRSEEHTSELQSPCNLVCRLLLEKKKKHKRSN